MRPDAAHQRRFSPVTPLMGAAVVSVALAILAAIVATPFIERQFLIRAGTEQQATLRLAVQGLRSELERYAPIPALIAERPELRIFLGNPENRILKAQAEQLLAQTAIALRAQSVHLEDASGRVIAAVPDGGEGDPENRPYFAEAVAGGLGQYYALGSQSGKRGYVYAAPVRGPNRIQGVVTVRFSVAEFEKAWQPGGAEIIVRDPNGIVFMSSRPDWVFRETEPLSEDRRRQIWLSGQYPIGQIRPLANDVRPLADGITRRSFGTGAEREGFVASTALVARAGWRVTILTPDGPVLAQARMVTATLILSILVAGLAGGLVLLRRARMLERFEEQRIAQDMLERRVAERTAELNTVNTQLLGEIEERRLAEERLRKTQADLVQAGKLAALGQMSAALSHEINQPLAAVKTYAENAIAYLARDRRKEAGENIRQISSLADRMSAISKHLRNFARRPQERTIPVPVDGVIDDALALLDGRIAASGARVERMAGEADVWATGGRVRLQQVVVNLVTNALDATAGRDDPVIRIRVEAESDTVAVTVRDNGPGLTDEAMKLLFDPFFTTKDPGKGLGLGLSISYNIVRDFGGTLSAHNHADGGAVFRITLKRCAVPGEAEAISGVAAQ